MLKILFHSKIPNFFKSKRSFSLNSPKLKPLADLLTNPLAYKPISFEKTQEISFFFSQQTPEILQTFKTHLFSKFKENSKNPEILHKTAIFMEIFSKDFREFFQQQFLHNFNDFPLAFWLETSEFLTNPQKIQLSSKIPLQNIEKNVIFSFKILNFFSLNSRAFFPKGISFEFSPQNLLISYEKLLNSQEKIELSDEIIIEILRSISMLLLTNKPLISASIPRISLIFQRIYSIKDSLIKSLNSLDNHPENPSNFPLISSLNSYSKSQNLLIKSSNIHVFQILAALEALLSRFPAKIPYEFLSILYEEFFKESLFRIECHCDVYSFQFLLENLIKTHENEQKSLIFTKKANEKFFEFHAKFLRISHQAFFKKNAKKPNKSILAQIPKLVKLAFLIEFTDKDFFESLQEGLFVFRSYKQRDLYIKTFILTSYEAFQQKKRLMKIEKNLFEVLEEFLGDFAEKTKTTKEKWEKKDLVVKSLKLAKNCGFLLKNQEKERFLDELLDFAMISSENSGFSKEKKLDLPLFIELFGYFFEEKTLIFSKDFSNKLIKCIFNIDSYHFLFEIEAFLAYKVDFLDNYSEKEAFLQKFFDFFAAIQMKFLEIEKKQNLHNKVVFVKTLKNLLVKYKGFFKGKVRFLEVEKYDEIFIVRKTNEKPRNSNEKTRNSSLEKPDEKLLDISKKDNTNEKLLDISKENHLDNTNEKLLDISKENAIFFFPIMVNFLEKELEFSIAFLKEKSFESEFLEILKYLGTIRFVLEFGGFYDNSQIDSLFSEILKKPLQNPLKKFEIFYQILSNDSFYKSTLSAKSPEILMLKSLFSSLFPLENPSINPLNSSINPLNSSINPLNSSINPLNSSINPLNSSIKPLIKLQQVLFLYKVLEEKGLKDSELSLKIASFFSLEKTHFKNLDSLNFNSFEFLENREKTSQESLKATFEELDPKKINGKTAYKAFISSNLKDLDLKTLFLLEKTIAKDFRTFDTSKIANLADKMKKWDYLALKLAFPMKKSLFSEISKGDCQNFEEFERILAYLCEKKLVSSEEILLEIRKNPIFFNGENMVFLNKNPMNFLDGKNIEFFIEIFSRIFEEENENFRVFLNEKEKAFLCEIAEKKLEKISMGKRLFLLGILSTFDSKKTEIFYKKIGDFSKKNELFSDEKKKENFLENLCRIPKLYMKTSENSLIKVEILKNLINEISENGLNADSLQFILELSPSKTQNLDFPPFSIGKIFNEKPEKTQEIIVKISSKKLIFQAFSMLIDEKTPDFIQKNELIGFLRKKIIEFEPFRFPIEEIDDILKNLKTKEMDVRLFGALEKGYVRGYKGDYWGLMQVYLAYVRNGMGSDFLLENMEKQLFDERKE